MLEKIRSAQPCKHILKEAMNTSTSALMTSLAHRPLHKPGFSENVERGQCGPLKQKNKKSVWKKAPSHPASGCFWNLIIISAEFHAEGNSWTTGMEIH